MKLPYFKSMSDANLRAAYRAYRESAHQGGKVAAQNPTARGATRRTIAASWGDSIRACEIIERLADKRGISLRIQDDSSDFTCSNCGCQDITGEGHCEPCRRVVEIEG